MSLLVLFLACPSPKNTDDSEPVTEPTESETTTSSNHPPSAATIAITPATPGDNDDLTVTIVTPSEDPDGDAVGYRFEWTKDGAAASTDETIAADLTTPNEVWAVTVTPSDGAVDGPAATAEVTIVGNQVPVAPVIHIEPTAPVAGDTLDLIFDANASDPDGDALSQEVHWTLNGVAMSNFDNKLTIPGKQVKGGTTWEATVSVSDSINPAVEVSTSVTVADQAPVMDSVVISPASPTDSQDFTCIPSASDPDRDTLTYSYRWLRDGVEESSLLGQNVVPAGTAVIGEVWTCEVTVTDGFLEDSGSATATIVEPTRVWYKRTINATLTSDGNGGWTGTTGSFTFLLQTTGATYGTNDCYAVWNIVGTPKTRACRGCDFDFTLEATYDASQSALNTSSCSTLAADGTGEFYYTMATSAGGYGSGNATISDVPLYLQYYSSYYSSSFALYPELSLGENSGGSYGAYTYDYVTTVNYDSYGNMLFYGRNYMYLTR